MNFAAFLVQKWPFRDAHLLFKKKRPETPIFVVFLGCALLGQGVKKGKIWKAAKKNGKIWLITEKLFFCIFAVFFWGFFFVFFVLFFLCFLFSLFFTLFFCCFFLFFVFFVFGFVYKNLVFPLEKGIFCLFSVFLFLSPLALFWPPSFLFLFLCLSLSLLFFSCFLPCCLCFLLSFGFLFWSLSLLFFLLCFSFMKGTASNYSIASFSSSRFSLFFWFPVYFFVSSSFFLSLLFPDFKLCFLFNIKVFGFNTNNFKKQKFWSKRGLQ